MKKNKWILAVAAVIMLARTWLNQDMCVWQQCSPADLVPVIVITVVIFLIKTGVLSAVLIGIRKLCERLRKK